MKKIFELLQERDISQYRLAKETGISEGNVTGWKAGRALPSVDALIKLSKYFDVSTDYLLGLTDNPAPSSATTPGISLVSPPILTLYNQLDGTHKKMAISYLEIMLTAQRAKEVK